MTIEILYLDGCPNHERLLEHLPGLLEGAGIEAQIVVREVADLAQAESERFLGSPTIRVAGRDVEPKAAHRDDYGLKCRIYHSPVGMTGLPPDEWILAALADANGPTLAP